MLPTTTSRSLGIVPLVKVPGRQRSHTKVPSADAFTISIDAAGPFTTGEDVDGEDGKYILVGVFTLPIKKEGDEYNLASPEAGQVLKDEGVDPTEDEPGDGPLFEALEEEADEDPPPREDLPRDREGLDAWERDHVEENVDISIRNYTMVEILPSRGVAI